MPKDGLRPSYADDAQYLVRLATAVENDVRQYAEWRRRLSAHLQAAAAMLTEAIISVDGR